MAMAGNVQNQVTYGWLSNFSLSWNISLINLLTILIAVACVGQSNVLNCCVSDKFAKPGIYKEISSNAISLMFLNFEQLIRKWYSSSIGGIWGGLDPRELGAVLVGAQ